MTIRWDRAGIFWEDKPVERGTRAPIIRTMPSIPDTGWTPPKDFPNLAAAKMLSFDVETYDPELFTKGPGWATGNGHMVGLSVGTDCGKSWYFPMRHEVQAEMNLDPANVMAWADENLTRKNQPKIGANLQYDIGWMKREGVNVVGPFIDVQYAEPLLDEHRWSYSLSSLAQTWLNDDKIDEALYEWCWRAYGGKEGRPQAGNIYRAPPCLVGPYAEGDADLPMRIWQLQQKELEAQGLMDLFKLECQLLPLLVEMRWRGVPVNIEGAARVQEEMNKQEAVLDKKLGFNVECTDELVRAFEKAGLHYPKTAKGNPSFAAPVLQNISHELPEMILAKRKLAKARGTFVEGYILDKAVNGRIHCEFHPLRSDDGGTVSGRFSSSHPNLQNIPARDPIMKKLIRGLFLPEDGCDWVSVDYSQIEYRFMVHAAVGPGAEEARQRYRNDPTTDYHVMTQDMLKTLLGREIDRKPVKNINFGKIFGMGKKALKRQLAGLTDAEAELFFDAYEDAVPYAKTTAERATSVASRKGYLRTILGRRARFPFWEPAKYYDAVAKEKILKDDPTYFDLQRDRDAAVNKWSRIKRARTHKALNAYTQGSGADLIKKAMVALFNEGIIPMLTVHDELDFSFVQGDNIIIDTTKEIMEDVLKLKIPVLATIERGTNWGNIK